MANPNAPFYPIIYVRGYAMRREEIDETTADPFCGFNLGSTVYRATAYKNKSAQKFIFESPVLRLGSDFGYKDVFENGLDITDPDWTDSIPSKSIIIYHYYEKASTLLGTGETPGIKEFAKGLGKLILRTRDLVCQDPPNKTSAEDFRCYLVAHSMGGLVCRTFLQNPQLDKDEDKKYIAEAVKCVDKVFTYATPHNGIEMAGFNVPSWLSKNDINNFNQGNMAEYLNLERLYETTNRVDWLPEEAFPSEKFFCMIGTNRSDYEVAEGLSRTFAGHGSDGLVRIENASVWGVNAKEEVSTPSATAYAYRSHSGFFGIVNSEESYQNLVRFLFGRVRVDIWVDIKNIRLPVDIQREKDKGKEINALYQIEILASPLGKRWYLTRRMAEEDSVACRSYIDLVDPQKEKLKRLYLSGVFLDPRWRVNPDGKTLAYSLTLGIRVPDYEVNRKFWPDQHYEGGYLFRESVVIEMTSLQEKDANWKITYDWHNDKLGKGVRQLDPRKLMSEGIPPLTLPFDSNSTPGIGGELRFVLSAWNANCWTPDNFWAT